MNEMRDPSSSRMPARRADLSPPSSTPARARNSTDGWSAAAATVTARRASGSSASILSARARSRVGGSVTVSRSSEPARASSRANMGLPPETLASFSSCGRERCVPSADASTLPSWVAESGPISTRCSAEPQSSSPRGGAAVEPASERAATRTRTGDGRTRRRANSSTDAVGRSSHWTSSTATSTRFSPERPRRSSSTPRDSACRSTGLPDDARASTASIAADCGSARRPTSSSDTVSSRSPSAAYGSSCSLSAGLAASTWKPKLRARVSSTPASQTVVLPIPASPAKKSARGSERSPPRSASSARSSASRPTMPAMP